MATPVFLPGESHGQRSLASYSPEGCKEWDMTEQLTCKHIFNLWYMYFVFCDMKLLYFILLIDYSIL